MVLRALRAETGAPHAIGLSGQMHGLVALDSRGRPLCPAILWNDQRTARECAEIEERIGLARLIALTGNRALPGFTAPKAAVAAPPRAGGMGPGADRDAAQGLRSVAAARPPVS